MNESAMDGAAGLPASERVDVGTLSRIFEDRATSYKYFFFLALLNRLERSFNAIIDSQSDIAKPVPLADLAIDMVLLAWYPSRFCRLSLGRIDQLRLIVDKIDWGEIQASFMTSQSPEWKGLRQRVLESNLWQDLVRYVPFRFIRPFFRKETERLPDHKVNEAIAEIASASILQKKPFYRFTDARDAIIINHDWVLYFKANLPIVREWARFKLCKYLQLNNPNVQGVISKIEPPSVRSPLTEATTYWRKAFAGGGLSLRQCMYSGLTIHPQHFSLDHFLPWSFVAHDRIWNLVPTVPAVNSMKSNSLPDEHYVEKLAEYQLQGLAATYKTLKKSDWQKRVEPFIIDLRLDFDGLLSRKIVTDAYKNNILPLLGIAKNQGFQSGWTYRAAGARSG